MSTLPASSTKAASSPKSKLNSVKTYASPRLSPRKSITGVDSFTPTGPIASIERRRIPLRLTISEGTPMPPPTEEMATLSFAYHPNSSPRSPLNGPRDARDDSTKSNPGTRSVTPTSLNGMDSPRYANDRGRISISPAIPPPPYKRSQSSQSLVMDVATPRRHSPPPRHNSFTSQSTSSRPASAASVCPQVPPQISTRQTPASSNLDEQKKKINYGKTSVRWQARQLKKKEKKAKVIKEEGDPQQLLRRSNSGPCIDTKSLSNIAHSPRPSSPTARLDRQLSGASSHSGVSEPDSPGSLRDVAKGLPPRSIRVNSAWN